MSISISRIAISLALLATVLPAFATRSDSAALSSFVAAPATSAGSCQSYIDWNVEKGVWRMNCGDAAVCCTYDSLRRSDGSIAVWCDCSVDGRQPECCHEVLLAFPDDPFRGAERYSDGGCSEGCGDLPWEDSCGLYWRANSQTVGGAFTGILESACSESR